MKKLRNKQIRNISKVLMSRLAYRIDVWDF